MMSYNLSNYLILSSNCSITKGFNRSLIQDLSRNTSNLIPNDYYDLIKYIDRKKLDVIILDIEDSSKSYFFDFLNFMDENEYAIFVEDILLFPKKSEVLEDKHVILKDCIIEIENITFNIEAFKSNLEQLDNLFCENIQLWIKDVINPDFIMNIMNILNNFNFLCIELCVNNSKIFERDFYLNIIDDNPCISKIYLFNADDSFIYEHISIHENKHPLLIGQLIYVDHPLDANNCGIINFENLTFGIESQFRVNENFNGCLYKKIYINSTGQIKNCPHFSSSHYGGKIIDVINESNFQKSWLIKKDDIEICKDCEFRYNCTDCRAFTMDKNNLYSKPLKCNYSPYTNEWKKYV